MCDLSEFLVLPQFADVGKTLSSWSRADVLRKPNCFFDRICSIAYISELAVELNEPTKDRQLAFPSLQRLETLCIGYLLERGFSWLYSRHPRAEQLR
jgi:hypothetical protein